MKPIRIGVLGAGVVASGVVKVLARNHEEIRRRAGRHIEVARVAARNPEKARAALGEGEVLVMARALGFDCSLAASSMVSFTGISSASDTRTQAVRFGSRSRSRSSSAR